VIVVAQRVSSIVDADQILVLDHGELVGKGTHEELLESCATYVEIVQSQLPAEVAA
jgi:ATP-binding cassette subfamily B protein